MSVLKRSASHNRSAFCSTAVFSWGGICKPLGQHGPRTHDFCHSFAVNRLLAWYREGANLSAKLPVLCTYLVGRNTEQSGRLD